MAAHGQLRVSFPIFDLVWVSFALDFVVRTQMETECVFIIRLRLFLQVRILTRDKDFG